MKQVKKGKGFGIEYGKWYFYIWTGKKKVHLRGMPKKRVKKELSE